MQVIERRRPNLGVPNLEEKVFRDVEAALHSVATRKKQFVVNDTDWYWVNPAGKVMPTVVNSAYYITSKFQSHLASLGWTKEKTINKQTIDGYIEFVATQDAWFCSSVSFVELLTDIEHLTRSSSGPFATEIYQRFFLKGSPTLDGVPGKLHQLFSRRQLENVIRLGLEFETGNIASSFRATTKLENLFRAGTIDAGVFITSIDKRNAATRIWPTSNRNGSFEELDNRNFRDELSIPLWEIGFAPDSFDQSAPYLGNNGTLYEMEDTGRVVDTSQGSFRVFRDYKHQEKLLPDVLTGFVPIDD